MVPSGEPTKTWSGLAEMQLCYHLSDWSAGEVIVKQYKGYLEDGTVGGVELDGNKIEESKGFPLDLLDD
jgi:hypothetical protein